MPTCPSCHRDQDRSTAFCVYCGAVLDRPASAVPGAPAPPPSDVDAPRRRGAARDDPAQLQLGDAGAYVIRRFLALLADGVVWGFLVALILSIGAAHMNPTSRAWVPWSGRPLIWWVVAFACLRWWFEGLFGATPGKLLFALGVVRADGRFVGLGRALLRTLLLPVDLLAIGFLIAAVDRKRRRLGDLFAGTRVVNARVGMLAPVLGLTVFAAAGACVVALAGSVASAEGSAEALGAKGLAWSEYWWTHGFTVPPPAPSPSASPPAPAASPTAAASPAAGASAGAATSSTPGAPLPQASPTIRAPLPSVSGPPT